MSTPAPDKGLGVVRGGADDAPPPPPSEKVDLPGAVLLEIIEGATDLDLLAEVFIGLDPAMFGPGPYRTIFRTMAGAVEQGDAPTFLAVRTDLETAGEVEALEALRDLYGSADTHVPAWLPHHSKKLRELWAARTLQDRVGLALSDTDRPLPDRLGAVEEYVRSLRTRVDGCGVRFLTEREVDAIPDTVPLVGDPHHVVIPDRSLVMVEGESGDWKSFTVIDVGKAVQHKTDSALGPIGRQGRVVMIAGEGAPGLKRRFAAWRAYHGGLDYGGLLVLKDPPKLNRPEAAARVMDALRSLEEAPAMVVVDTVNTSIEGSENDREDAGAFLDFGRQVRDEFGATFLYVHHMNAEGRKHRGHTSFFDDADCVMRVVREGDNRARVECRKQKDAPPFQPIHLEVVPYAESLVLRRTEGSTEVDRRDAPEYIRATLRQIDRSTAEGEGLATTKWEAICREELDLSSSTFYRHRTMLIRCGFVRTEEVGGGTRNHVTEGGSEWLS